MDAWLFYLQRSGPGEPQTYCDFSPSYSGYSPLCTLSSLAIVREETNVPKEAYYGAYVYDIGHDKVHEASQMFREWKISKCMDEDTINLYRLIVGYEKG